MKSEQSIRLKYAKGLKSGLRFNTVFNDLIGLRIKVQEYHDSYPDYFRVVDMRNGKKNYVCKRLERQELAVIETGQDDDTVNLIFSRINSIQPEERFRHRICVSHQLQGSLQM